MNAGPARGGGDGIARELAGLAGAAERLLVLHVPDPHGRCRGCTAPGTGTPDARWPCALHFYASAAQQIRTQQIRTRTGVGRTGVGRTGVGRPRGMRQTEDLRQRAARELTEA